MTAGKEKMNSTIHDPTQGSEAAPSKGATTQILESVRRR